MPTAAASVVTRAGPFRLSSLSVMVALRAAPSVMCRTMRIAACSSPSATSSRLTLRDDCFTASVISHLHRYPIDMQRQVPLDRRLRPIGDQVTGTRVDEVTSTSTAKLTGQIRRYRRWRVDAWIPEWPERSELAHNP